MGQQVSVTKLKEQIEAAKRGLADMSPVITAVDPAFQPVAMPAVKFAGVAGGHVDDAPDVIDQNMVANDDMAKDDMAKDDMAKVIWPRMILRPVKGFNFFIAPNGLSSHLSRHRA